MSSADYCTQGWENGEADQARQLLQRGFYSVVYGHLGELHLVPALHLAERLPDREAFYSLLKKAEDSVYFSSKIFEVTDTWDKIPALLWPQAGYVASLGLSFSQL